jgi:hypothetical protein
VRGLDLLTLYLSCPFGHRYMTSFAKPEMAMDGWMAVPVSIFDSWLSRFESKYRIDPNFMMKQD